MALYQSPQREKSAQKNAVALYCVYCVLRTAGRKAARWSEKGRYQYLIESDYQYRDCPRHSADPRNHFLAPDFAAAGSLVISELSS